VGRTWLERFLRSTNYPDLYTLCDDIFPNHRTQHVPTPPTTLIGRDQDITATLAKLKDGHVRLLTLTGAPGVGKTRLALHLATDVRSTFEDGIAFVRLSAIRQPEMLTIAVAGALGLVENDDQTLPARLLAFLQDRNLLLLLDNFEHVIAAAPRVADLLLAAPHLKVLVTSREPLHIYGEHEYVVLPLALPKTGEDVRLEAFSRVPSVQLFVERATAANPNFRLSLENREAVADVCARLDGLPLAIELAASRSKWLTPDEMLTQLNDRLALLVGGPRDWPARQQTLQAAIDWSYNLLSESEQRLFRWLGVFLGGCTLEAVEMVCGQADRSAHHVAESKLLSILESLQDKNLIYNVHHRTAEDQPRYSMLETIREYAYAQLQAADEATEAHQRHRDWCLNLAEQAERNLRGPDQLIWLNRLEQETHNLRGALTWCLAHPAAVEPGLRLAGALYWFWHLHSHFSEGCDWLDKMLALKIEPDAPLSTRRARAKALCVAAQLHGFEVNSSRATALSESGFALSLEIGDIDGIVFALTTPLLTLGGQPGGLQRTIALAEEILPLCRAAGDRFGVAQLLDNVLGPAALAQGDLVRAVALHEEALALRRDLGDLDGIAWSLFLLAGLALINDDEARAQALYEESRTLWQQVGNRRMYANALNELGRLTLKQDRYFQAKALFEESLATYEGFGDRCRAALAQCSLAVVACQQRDYELAYTYLRKLAATVQDFNRPPLIADYFSAVAGLAYATGALEHVVRLISVAQSALDRTTRQRMMDHARHEEMLMTARTVLDQAVFDQAWLEGQTMTLEAAVAYVLDEAIG
jgi:predicted ATPase